MTVLTSAAIEAKGIVHGAVPEGRRPTTYDATVGSIIRCGVEVEEEKYTLAPRHIVWVVSAETFRMGDTVTGLATLKTRWTHRGLLALNVGVVDPGWDGPLATAIVNLSNSDIEIRKGVPFFRLLFQSHAKIAAKDLDPKRISREDYVAQVAGYSRSFSPTFLNMEDLSRTVADKVLGFPRWGLIISLIATVLALLSITVPVAVTIAMDTWADKTRLATLEAKVAQADPAGADPKRKALCKGVVVHRRPYQLCTIQ